MTMKKKIEKKGSKLIIKITNTLMTGSLVGKGIDGNGNPIHGFLLVDYVTPEDFEAQINDFKQKYKSVELQNGAHRIKTGFNEVINNGKKLKEVTQFVEQELYKDGKWKPMKPNRSGEHVEVVGNQSGWTTAKKWIVAIIIGSIAVATYWLTR